MKKKNAYFDWKNLQLRRGKRPKRRMLKSTPHRGTVRPKMPDARGDVVSALVNLGYPKFSAKAAAQKASGSDFESIFRSALGTMKAKNPRVFPGSLTGSEISALRKLVTVKTMATKKRERQQMNQMTHLHKSNAVKHSPGCQFVSTGRYTADCPGCLKLARAFSKRERQEDKVGQRVRKPIGGSPYVITKVRKVNPDLVEAIRPGDRVTIWVPAGFGRGGQEWSKKSGRAVMRSSGGGWVLNMGGPHGTPGIASEENIVSVKKRNPKKKKRSKSRKGVMPAGLRKYWAKKRAAKAKRSNPKKKRRTRRKNIRGLHPVARLREYKRQRKGGSSRKKSLRVALSSRNPPRKRRVKIIKTNLRKGTKAFRQFVAATRAKYGSARVL